MGTGAALKTLRGNPCAYTGFVVGILGYLGIAAIISFRWIIHVFSNIQLGIISLYHITQDSHREDWETSEVVPTFLCAGL